MSNVNDLIELGTLLDDIAEMLGRAERMADDISGAEPGRAPIDQMVEEPCHDCDGCGKVADTWEREPWSAWVKLPVESSAAVLSGLVRPVPCPTCRGTGKWRYRHTDPGTPAVEGWPAMVRLADALGQMAGMLRSARTPEIIAAIEGANREAADAPEPIAPGDHRFYERR